MPDPSALLTALDPEQRVVATTLTGPMAVLAGAGTGKTRAITHRIAYGVATGVYDPRQVLAVTFTTRAAGEMRHRLGELGARGVQAKTFHAAALGQARHFWPQVHSTAFPSVLDKKMSLVAEAAGRLRVKVDTATLRDLTSEISWSKVSNVTPDSYLGHAQGRSVAGVDPATVGKVFGGYEALKRDRDRVDFEDILLCTAALLAEHEDVAAQFRRTYRWLVVDEYQDVSPLQQALLDLWRGDREDICVVGDPAQTIHTFAGARAEFLTGFAHRHPQAEVVRLVRDYRSTPQVVRAANAVIAAGGGRSGAVTLQAQRPTGPEVVLTEAADEPSEAKAVADWLAGLADQGVQWREMALLFRVNSQSPAFEAALADRQIPYLVRNAERFYDRAEVRQALLVIRTEAKVAGSSAEDGGRGAAEAGPRGAAGEVRALLAGLGWSAEAPSGAGAVRERWESLAAIVAVADDVVATNPASNLAVISAELDRRAEAQQVPTAQGVTLGTLHSAKGLEWDAVAVVGVHEGSLPFVLAQGADEVAEECRLLYVGITRARKHLQLSWSRSRSGGTRRNPSRFLAPLRPESTSVSSSPARSKARRRDRQSAQTQTCRSCGTHLTTAAERKLGRHETCASTYDENLLERLRAWRKEQAAEQKLPAYCIFTDATLTALAEAEPTDQSRLLRIHGLGKVKAEKYGEHVLAIVQQSLEQRHDEAR